METTALIGALIAAAPVVATSPIALAMLAALGVVTATFGATQVRRPGLVEQRLGSFGQSVHSLEELELQLSFRDRVLAPAMRGMSRVLLRYTPVSTLESYRHKLILAGSPSGLEVRDFLGLKGLLAIGLGGGYALLSNGLGVGPSSLLIAVAIATVGFYGPNVWLATRISRRQRKMLCALPDTLDLLTICVEAGLGFDAAIQRVVEKRDDELSHEFGRVLQEMRVGRGRRDALKSLAERTDVPDVNTFVSAMVQSEQLGVPISKVLVTQAAQMRVKRRQRAEETAHKAPIKMLFPMALLIFPALFVILLGPTIPKIMSALGGL
jgi:tight adherence protein C